MRSGGRLTRGPRRRRRADQDELRWLCRCTDGNHIGWAVHVDRLSAMFQATRCCRREPGLRVARIFDQLPPGYDVDRQGNILNRAGHRVADRWERRLDMVLWEIRRLPAMTLPDGRVRA